MLFLSIWNVNINQNGLYSSQKRERGPLIKCKIEQYILVQIKSSWHQELQLIIIILIHSLVCLCNVRKYWIPKDQMIPKDIKTRI